MSVVIPTLNRPDDLRRCLIAIKAQDRPPDEMLLVIGPGDMSAATIFWLISAGDPRWKIINETRASVVISLNRGIRETLGDIIILTDDDAAPPTCWLSKIEKHFQDCRVGAVGGRDRLMYSNRPDLTDPLPARNVGKFNWYGALQGNHHCGSKKSPLEIDVLKGVNLSFRRIAFPKGQIDNYLIGQGAEVGWEIDICLTLRRAGWKVIYDNDVYVDHHIGPRNAGDNRLDIKGSNACRRVQNIAYLIAAYQPIIPTLILLFRATVFGSRRQPGFILGSLGFIQGHSHDLSVASKVICAYLRGTRDGKKKIWNFLISKRVSLA